METKTTFAIAEIKSAKSASPNGEFELVMSTDSVDRDGESIVKGAFNPLPASIPVHAFHDFNDPIGRVVPSYDDAGQLIGRGFFASTPRAQEIRQLVVDGIIGHSSVGFMSANRVDGDDEKGSPPQVIGAELLEVSLVSVPSNRDAAVTMIKSMRRYDAPELATAPEAPATTVAGKLPVSVGEAEPIDDTTPATDVAGKSWAHWAEYPRLLAEVRSL